MSKKFWKRGPVARLLQNKPSLLKKPIINAVGRASELEALSAELPAPMLSWEGGVRVLDRRFPIREGHSQVDYLVANGEGELIFIWVRRVASSEALSKLLPDYDWAQKNQALWPHLFPELLQRRSFQMKVWILALEIEPEVKCFLSYLSGIRLKIFKCRQEAKGDGWSVTPWERWQEEQGKVPGLSLPGSPSPIDVLPASPKPSHASSLLLTQEEVNDLIGMVPGDERWHEDETTDPHYDPSLQ